MTRPTDPDGREQTYKKINKSGVAPAVFWESAEAPPRSKIQISAKNSKTNTTLKISYVNPVNIGFKKTKVTLGPFIWHLWHDPFHLLCTKMFGVTSAWPSLQRKILKTFKTQLKSQWTSLKIQTKSDKLVQKLLPLKTNTFPGFYYSIS